jgi:superfamily II DNA or RNA helicase
LENILKIQNAFSCLYSTDEILKGKLHRGLRARPKNYWHNKLYKRKIWDGWEEFFKPKTGMFLTGLLPEVQYALRALNRTYTTQDETNRVGWTHPQIDEDFLNGWLPSGYSPITLHDFQPDLVNQALKYHRGIIKAPTGAGKTYCLISLLHCLPPKTPVLFLTKGMSLVDQNYEEMKLWGIQNVGRWYDKYKEPNFITCATIHAQTFNSLEKLLPRFKVLIVDEVHDAVSDIPIKAYKKMTGASIRIGFSATPFRYDKKKIDKVHQLTVKGHFGPVFKTSTTDSGFLTTKDLQERGILSNSNCTFYKISTPDLAYEPYQDAIKLGLEQNFEFHKLVVRLARSRPGRTLVIVERIEQGEYLHQLMPEAAWIQGKDNLDVRVPVIDALKKGDKCCAIVMRQIITAGINVRIHNLINASGGYAAHNLIQQVGRGLRTANDKEILEYYDFLFTNNPYLWRHSDWRMEVLKNEGHQVTLKEVYDF